MKSGALYQVKIVKEFNDFLLLENHWGSLCQSSLEICPMVTHGWLAAWWKTFGAGLQMHIVTVWDKDVLIAAAPLAIKEKKWGFFRHRILMNWVNVWVDRYVWLIDAAHPVALTSILDSLMQDQDQDQWNELFLQRQPTDILQSETIGNYFSAKPFTLMHLDDLESPYMVLTSTEEELMESLSSGFRQSLKRKLRTIEKQKNVKMWISENADCEAAIADISVETWQHQQGSSMVATPDIRSFFHAVICSAAREKNLRVAIMTIDDEFSAFEFNIKCRNKLHNLKLGYKAKFTDLSVGLVLKHFVLTSLMNNSSQDLIVEYDLMGTSEAYKLNWAKQIRHHQSVRVLPNKLTNLLWRVKYQYKDWLRNKFPSLFHLMKLMKNRLRRKHS